MLRAAAAVHTARLIRQTLRLTFDGYFVKVVIGVVVIIEMGQSQLIHISSRKCLCYQNPGDDHLYAVLTNIQEARHRIPKR